MADVVPGEAGGPAVEEAPPSTKKITIGGQEREFPAADADLISRELQARDTRYTTELQRLSQQVQTLNARLEPPPDEPPPGPRPPAEELFHENPREWQRQFDSYQDQKIEQRLAAERQQQAQRDYTRDQETQRGKMWEAQVQNFYKRHEDLQGAEDVVDAQFRAQFGKYQTLPVDEALDKIGEHARQRLVELGERGKAVGSVRATVLESSRRRSVAAPAAAEADKPETAGISRVVRQMQARMRGGKVA